MEQDETILIALVAYNQWKTGQKHLEDKRVMQGSLTVFFVEQKLL
jgi:hypothetical protein